MFRLIRFFVLLMVAFVAGVFFERNAASERCVSAGAKWLRTGVCSVTGDAHE
ncbi:hypothetical protein [Primorskyibacter sp. 2E233]|uniref:hypothetical protein n=1 Tax=Primorskyibacter sp. 2E233 TaxID=3413431 RepID=UPI003BF05783